MDIGEIIKQIDDSYTQNRPLHERIVGDWERLISAAYREEERGGDKEDTDWDNFTSNSAAILGNWAIDTLSSAPLIISIPTTTEKKSERKANSKTELYCYGGLNQANDWLSMLGQSDIQGQLSFCSCLTGWTVARVLLYEKEDEDGILPDVAIWNILNVSWGMGGSGISWVSHDHYEKVELAEDYYNVSNLEHDNQGRVFIHDRWDNEKEIVIVSNRQVHEHKHGLDRVPVRIQAAGSRQMIQIPAGMTSSKLSVNEEAIKYKGESVYRNVRDLFDEEHEVMTYHKTQIGLGIKTPTVLKVAEGDYDKVLEQFKTSPYVKGRVLVLPNTADVKEFYKPTMPENTSEFYSILKRQIEAGGVSNIVLGAFDQAGPASGLNILTHAARNILMAHKKNIESCLSWICQEMVMQYKDGDFDEVHMQGRDKLNKEFAIDVTQDEITTDRNIVCEIRPKMPQDEMARMGMGSTALRDRRMSRRGVMEKYDDIVDPDAMIEEIDVEELENNPIVKIKLRVGAMLKDDPKGNAEAAMVLNAIADEMISRLFQQQYGRGGGGQPNAPGVPQPPNPAAGVATASQPLQIPPEITQAIRTARGR